jgi:hypothetical protein
LAVGNVVLRKDRVDRAFGNTQRAVNAFIGVDDQHVGAFAKTIYRAHINAVGILALDAALDNNVSHSIPSGIRRL